MKKMKKFGRGGSQYPESDPRNPINREGMDLVREGREPPRNPPIPKKKPVKKAEGGEVAAEKKSGGGRKFDAGKFALGMLSPLGGLLINGTPPPLFSLLQGKNPLDPYMTRRRRGTEDALMRSTGAAPAAAPGMKKGGKVKKYAKGGSVSKRADGCAQRGKTRGKMV